MDGKKSGAKAPKETKYEKAKKKFVESIDEKNKRIAAGGGKPPLLPGTKVDGTGFGVDIDAVVDSTGSASEYFTGKRAIETEPGGPVFETKECLAALSNMGLLLELDRVDEFTSGGGYPIPREMFGYRDAITQKIRNRLGITKGFDELIEDGPLKKLEGRLNNHRHKKGGTYGSKPEY